MRFYRGEMFPQKYRNQIFIAEHGSWNRTVPDGYRVMRIRFDADGAILDFKVMVRPLKAVNKVWEQMAAMLERQKA